MTRERARKLIQAVSCALYGLATLKYVLELSGTEFGGGRLTGALLNIGMVGGLLAWLLLPYLVFRPKTNAWAVCVASLMCAPWLLYFIVPTAFTRIFGGHFSVEQPAGLVWAPWAWLGMVAVLVALASTLIPGHDATA